MKCKIGTMEFDEPSKSVKNDSDHNYYYYYDCPLWLITADRDKVNSTSQPNSTTYATDLHEMNRRKSITFYPVFVVLGSIVVLGVLCNILVCYIYRCRSRRATSNFFVIFFAIFDITGCLVGIPLVVSDLALPYTYNVATACKVMGFVETWSVCGQCLTLNCVAYDCYRKLCRPTEDFNVKKARIWCIISVILAALVSIPALAVFDTRPVPVFDTQNGKNINQNMLGETCSIDPEKPQWLRILYNVCALGTFTVSLCVMTVFYCLIGVGWCRQRQAEERGEKPSPAKREFPKKHRFVREDTSSSSVVNYGEEKCRLHSQGSLSHSNSLRSDPIRVPLKSSNGGLIKTNSLQANSISSNVVIVQLHVKNTRQASIFIVISIVFVVFMLPYVVVMVLCAATTVFNNFSSNITEIVFNLCIRSYLINYLVKPVVYIIFNMNFRKEVKHLFNKILAFCTHSDTPADQVSTHQLRRSFTMSAQRSTSRTPIYRPPRSST